MKQPTPRRLLDTVPQSTLGGPGQRRVIVAARATHRPPVRRAPIDHPIARPAVEHAAPGRIRIPTRLGGAEPDIIEVLPPADPPGDGGIVDRGPLAFVVRRDEAGGLHLAPAWPLWALLVPFPIWWGLGLGSFIFPILAVPMAFQLARRRPLRVPPWFWLWVLFLIWTIIGLIMFTKTPPGTITGTVGGRLISIGVELIEYASATVTLLFIGNLSARELPQRRMLQWLAVLFLVTVFGGFLGTYVPTFQFSSPLELLLPGGLRTDPYIAALVHPNAAQVQSVLGSAGGRAAAPWGYTNFWANNLSLLLIWFVVGWGVGRSTGRKVVCGLVVAATLVPIVYSLNRGLWIGLVVSALWVAVRLFLRGRVIALFAVLAIGALGVIGFAETPLHEVFGARLQHGGSNDIRTFLGKAAIDGANRSPIIGWGGTRKTIGSNQSIAIGKTPACPQCGQFAIGSTGQFWTVIFYQGWVGAGFFVGFFGMTVWTYRRDRTAVAQGGVIAVALTFVYMLFYASLPAAFTITMISVGLLWRSRLDQEPPAAGELSAPGARDNSAAPA